MKIITSFISKLLSRYSFHNLLLWLLVYLVVGPFITGKHAQIILPVFISFVLFFAVYALNTKGFLFKYILILMGATLVLYWLNIFHVLTFSRMASRVIMAFYLGMLIYSFSRYVLTARKVTPRLISAALCLYLLMGTLWGIIYDIVNIVSPGSYSGYLLEKSLTNSAIFQHFQYFSFVTLTTLGYGDILPQSEGAAALCQVEAIIGQFFMAVLVARLVGIQVSQKFADKNR